MSLGEKRWWTYAAIVALVGTIYVVAVLREVGSTPAEDVAYQPLLLAAVGVGVVIGIVANILLRIAATTASPTGASQQDERDRDINRLGERVGGIVLAVALVLPFGLALLDARQFWIANTMYLAFSLSALAGSVAKVVLYRRGF